MYKCAIWARKLSLDNRKDYMSNNKPKTSQKADSTKVSAMDVCQTPPHALEPLYPHLKRMGYKFVWESAVGPENLIGTTLYKNGYNNIGTDLMYGARYNREIYNLRQDGFDYDIEITNVPFTIKYEWLSWAFRDGKPFAFIVPYETTAAEKFKKLFKQYNNKPWRIEKLSPERRINYKMPNKGWISSAQMPTCWITWGLEVHQSKNIDEVLFEYDVPMRNVKYDSNNNPIESVVKTNGRSIKEKTRQT
jgi:hypothetical protein